ncbi:hypothetical protein BU17DRAFT_85083 [Hysterangium stoloniferum]|nr:hypothetical protein BU17DRAFT_85083 [Hysterangium stoloniferum]
MAFEDVESYLRISAMSIAFYDAAWTIPAEIALYRDQKSFRQMTRACILFILIRYVSVLAIVLSNLGFFFHGFTTASCYKYYLIVPSFKATQTAISQIILGIRTIAIARQARWVERAILISYFITVVMEYFTNIYGRIPFRLPLDSPFTNCTSGNVAPKKVAWAHYLAAMLYDTLCLSIATRYIWVQARQKAALNINGLSRILLKEGILYFIFLTAANALNVVFYFVGSTQAQSSASTVGYAVTWIMSQRLILHLQHYKQNPRSASSTDGLQQPRQALPQYLSNSGAKGVTSVDGIELDVRVTVEESVKVDYVQGLSDAELRPHHLTTAQMEKGYRRREERRDKNDRLWTEAGGKC